MRRACAQKPAEIPIGALHKEHRWEMYIKKVVLEGFKSYAQRTEIDGFDPLFNAITGLNGSGKSNILDAICFLLGITNLSQVERSFLCVGVLTLFPTQITAQHTITLLPNQAISLEDVYTH